MSSLVEKAVDDNYPDYVYGEDDDTPEYEELYDNGVDVNAEVYHFKSTVLEFKIVIKEKFQKRI